MSEQAQTHLERARRYGEQHAADLEDAQSRAWLRKHGVRYVLPWRIEDWESLRAEFEAVAREAQKHVVQKVREFACHDCNGEGLGSDHRDCHSCGGVGTLQRLCDMVRSLDAAAEPKE